MNYSGRNFVKPITRKNKKNHQTQKSLVNEESNYELIYYYNGSEDLIELINDFEGKCILLINENTQEELENQKRNKCGDYQFNNLNQYPIQNKIESQIKEKFCSQENQEDISFLDTKSDTSDYDSIINDGVLLAFEGEINYLEDLQNFQNSVSLRNAKKRNYKQNKLYSPKIQQFSLNRQSKKIIKQY